MSQTKNKSPGVPWLSLVLLYMALTTILAPQYNPVVFLVERFYRSANEAFMEEFKRQFQKEFQKEFQKGLREPSAEIQKKGRIRSKSEDALDKLTNRLNDKAKPHEQSSVRNMLEPAQEPRNETPQ